MCSGLKVRFQVSRGVVAGSHQFNMMTLKVGSFVFRLRLENTQEPMSKYPIFFRRSLWCRWSEAQGEASVLAVNQLTRLRSVQSKSGQRVSGIVKPPTNNDQLTTNLS